MTLKQSIKDNVLPVINTVLRPLSLHLRGRGDPNRNFAEFIAHLRKQGFVFGALIDVGVAFGTPGIYRAMRGADFYLIEPVPACKPILEKFAKQYGATTFNVAAGDHDGVMSFHVHDDISGSSAFEQMEGAAIDGKLVEIPVRRIDSLIKQIRGPVLLKIDTQGFEIQVIEGAAALLDSIEVIIVETSFHEFRKGAPEIFDIMRKMDQLDYVPYEMLEGHYRPIDGAMAQVDVAFVKRNSVLRNEKRALSESQQKKFIKAA